MVWTIPKENHKTGKISKKPLKRPILPETQVLFLQLLELSGCDYLMTNSRSYQIMSKNSTVSLPYNLMQWLRKNANYEMAHWSLHDLRRTARTYWSSLCPPHIAEIMLGHTLSKEWGTYDQYLYLAEQTAAYSAWLNKLNEIIKLS
jgi:integrase